MNLYKLMLFIYEHFSAENIFAFWCINVYGEYKHQISLDSIQQW